MRRLIILGASARAAAGSAVRSGFTPWTADLFTDVDLLEMVPDAVRCPPGQYPQRFLEILEGAPDAPWLYTGAMENHPNLIRELAEIRPLWGNGPDSLAASRSPFRLEELLRSNGLPSLEVRQADGELSSGLVWLKKPFRGASGSGISLQTDPDPECYFQQFVEGKSMSAVFMATRLEVKLLGITEQLIGTGWLNAPPFRYAGNIGPIKVSEQCREMLTKIGQVLGTGCKLRGLFGVDFVLAEETPWAIEINPRYTASIEVLERASETSLLAEHISEYDESYVRVGETPWTPQQTGKAILYADHDLTVPAWGWRDRWPPHELSDIPAAGEYIQKGWPIVTLFARGDSAKACRERLKTKARVLKRVFK